MEIENSLDCSDFDISEYLNSDCDDTSIICDDFDFDLDKLLAVDYNCNSDGLKTVQGDLVKNDISTFISDFCANEINLSTNVPESYKCSSKAQKIVVPEILMTDEIKKEIEKVSNPLIIQLHKTEDSFKSKRLKDSKCMKKTLTTLLKSAQQASKLNEILLNDTVENRNQKLSCAVGEQLEKFAHCKGSILLPKKNCAAYTSLLTDQHISNKLSIHCVHIDSNSYSLMKSLCRDGIEYLAYRNGNVLLPKVQQSSKIFTTIESNMKIYKRENTLKYSKVRINSKYKTLSQIKNSQSNILQDKEEINLYDDCRIHSKDDNLQNERTKSDLNNEEIFDDKSSIEFDSSCYPNFKIRYLVSLRNRLDRINWLPLPHQEITLPIDKGFTDEEMTLLPEFFVTDALTSRYLQIRNHILECWCLSRPAYVSKTHVRSGLRHCGDVNLLSVVHKYLERKGAINFNSDLVHYAKESVFVKSEAL